MLNLPLSGIKKIEAVAQSSNEYISLSQGALRVGGIPQEIKDYLRGVLNTDKTDYYQSAWGIMPLREKIAHITNVNFDNVLVSHGCMGGLATIFFTLLDYGDEVIIPEPTYPAYEKVVSLARGKTVFISCRKKGSELWELDLDRIKRATNKKTKVIVFSNPWNPLGITISRDKILSLLEWCHKNKIYLIIDEAYKDYAFSDSFKSCVDLVKESEFLIQASSFSKNMAMSGWRVGYLIASEKLVQAFGGVQDALLNCPNVLAQYAALYALDHPEFTRNFHEIVRNNLNLTLELISPLIEENIFSYQKPTGSFFLFLKTQHEDSTGLCASILNNAKVTLIPGKFFGKSGASFLRLCYARDKELLGRGLAKLVKYFLN